MSAPVSSATAIEELRRADEEWAAALRGLAPYPERLRMLAQAAEREGRALLLGYLAKVNWNPRPGASKLKLAYEVEKESGRPGPPSVWTRFDKTVKELGLALEGDSIRALGEVFERLAEVTVEVADALEQAAAAGERKSG